jgi:hypothetical protein
LSVVATAVRRSFFLLGLISPIGYVTPADMLAGNEGLIWKQRDEKLEDAREARRLRRQRLQPDESVAKATTESRSR